MARLVNCKACNVKISSKAHACPQCGEPNNRLDRLKEIIDSKKCSVAEAKKILDGAN